MVNYATIQRKIDTGKGKAARKLGPPFLGYRITNASAGNFPNGWAPVVTPRGVNFRLFRRRMSEAKLETGIKGAAILFDIIADMSPFLLGDILVQNDPPYVPGISYGAGATSVPGTIELNAMALAWHGPVSKAVGARIDRRVTVYRPAASPSTQQDGSKYWESTHDKDVPLVLAGGQYSFGTPGGTNASLVPAGISTQHRQSDRPFTPDVPGMLKPVKWFFYLPPMPGYMAREGDTIVDENGARYVVVSPYEQQTGLVGQQLICDRTAAQSGEPLMASLHQVLDSIAVLVRTATAGLSPQPETAIGWPPLNRLQQIGQGAAPPAISIYDRRTVRNTSRWLVEVSAQTAIPAGIASAVSREFISATSPTTITLSGTPVDGDAVSCILTRFLATGGVPIVTAEVVMGSASTTLAQLATALAAAINADPVATLWVSAAAVGAVVTITPLFATGTLGIQSNTGNGGTQQREIGRRERQVQIVIWAQTDPQRQAITEAVTQALALADVNFGVTLADGGVARLTYGSDFDLEDNTLQDVYRHDFLVAAEYGITTLDQLFAVLAPVPGLVLDN